MARGTPARMRCGAEATWQGRGWPTRGAGGALHADTWQEATSVHGSPQTPMWGATWRQRVGIWRAHGIVGPGKIVGAVTGKRYTAPQFILNNVKNFFRVGLCPTHILSYARHLATERALDSIKTAEIAWTRVHAIVNQGRS